MKEQTDQVRFAAEQTESGEQHSSELDDRAGEPTLPGGMNALTKEQWRAAIRTHPQRRALLRLHDEVVGLKGRLWRFVMQKACARFSGGGSSDDVDALGEEVRRVATDVAETGSHIQADVVRHLVTTFAARALAICQLDALSAVSEMVRAYELYMAAEPALDRLIDEWTKCGPIIGLPGIDLEIEAAPASPI